jgi:hypothetical protein
MSEDERRPHRQPIPFVLKGPRCDVKPIRPSKAKEPTEDGRRRIVKIRKLAMTHAHAAILKIVDLMREGEPHIQLAAAKEILDRAMGKPAVVHINADLDKAVDRGSLGALDLRNAMLAALTGTTPPPPTDVDPE